MAVLTQFILTSAQSDAVQAFNNYDEGIVIEPFPVTAASPGSGLNLNENATGYGAGDPVALTGKYVAPSAILNDPQYQLYAPGMVAYLADKPFALLDDAQIYAH